MNSSHVTGTFVVMLLRDYPEFHLNLSFLPGEFQLPMPDRILCKAIFCFDVMNQIERETLNHCFAWKSVRFVFANN